MTATLTVSNADDNDEANYRCVVTNNYGNATSNEATLTVTTFDLTEVALELVLDGAPFANGSTVAMQGATANTRLATSRTAAASRRA